MKSWLSHTVQQSMMATLELQKDFVLMKNEKDTSHELMRQQVEKLNALQEEFHLYKSEQKSEQSEACRQFTTAPIEY